MSVNRSSRQDYPSQEVNRLRKSGRLDEAYVLGVATMAAAPRDRWAIGALGWCLIELMKRHSASPDGPNFQNYLRELENLPVEPEDEVLYAQKQRWLGMRSEAGRRIEHAKRLGKEGRHEDAIARFTELADEDKLGQADWTSFGWELCHAIQAVLKSGSGPTLAGAPIGKARHFLKTYFRLNISGPDLLHSRIAQQALALSKAGHVEILPFARLWDLRTFRREDHDRFRTDGGKALPALSERLLNKIGKEAVERGTIEDLAFFLPSLESISQKFPDNHWLKMKRVQFLARLGRAEEARELAIAFVRAKAREFWAWELLGDLVEDHQIQVGCYARALSLGNDDAFTGKLRVKFAKAIAGDHPDEAKAEVHRAIRSSEAAGHRPPAGAEDLLRQNWLRDANDGGDPRLLYDQLASAADAYLFATLPKRLAVIDHVNHDRKLFHFIVDKGVDGVAPFKAFGRTPSEGEVVLVRVDTVTGPEGRRTNLLSIEASAEPVPAHLGGTFRGEIRVSNGMGFMPNGTFVNPGLISSQGISDGDIVEGFALISYDKKKARWGLKATRATKAS